MVTSKGEESVRVLVVDDDPFAASLIRRLLEVRMPVEVESALDCASARRLLDERLFDVVAVDYRLPDSSGLDLIDEMNERDLDIPAILVTAHGSESLASKAFSSGAAAYLRKDQTLPDMLPDAVEEAMAQASLGRAVQVLNRENSFTASAINLLGQVFFILDPAGRFVRWNRNFNEVTGFTDEEIFETSIDELFPEGGGRRLLDNVLGLRRGETAVVELKVPTKNGGAVPGEFTAGVLTDSRGNLVGVCAIGARPVQAASRSAEPRDRAPNEMAELACGTMVRVDLEGRFTFLNDEACGLLGLPHAKVIRQKLTSFTHPDDLDGTLQVFTRGVRNRRPVTGFTSRLKTGRGWRYVEWNAAPLLDKYSEVTGFQFAGRDVTEQKLTEKFLTRVNVELDAYAHTVSHDLKAPVSAIMLAAETLRVLIQNGRMEDPDDTIGDISRIISEHSEKAGVIIDDLLVLAEAGQLPVAVEDVDVGAVVRQVIEARAQDIDKLRIKVVLDPDLGRVVGNRTQLNQVFSNLISNAIRHNDNSNPVIEVRYLGRSEAGNGYLVKDNGSGVPPADADNIFKAFVKGKSGGNGIGLATVQKIVRVYGGDIRVFNDNGACFEFTVKDADEASREPDRSEETDGSSKRPSLRRNGGAEGGR